MWWAKKKGGFRFRSTHPTIQHLTQATLANSSLFCPVFPLKIRTKSFNNCWYRKVLMKRKKWQG
jgi:hypothetical protein